MENSSYCKDKVRHLQYMRGNEWRSSESGEYMPLYNPSGGEVIAMAPCLSEKEIDGVVEAAEKAFPAWSATPVGQRVQVLFRFKQYIERDLEAIASLIATEMGKTHAEALGEVERGLEVVEYACGMPTHLAGESLENVSREMDLVTSRTPLGVCVGIVPYNFPAMIPLWMVPIAIACGNTFVLKAANQVPQSAMKLMELLIEAGLPAGVANLVTCGNQQAAYLTSHPKVKAVSFVGSSRVAAMVYETASRHGKRVQALAQAKNHCLVLPDCALRKTAQAIVNAAFGCGGQRCMALPCVVAHEAIAEPLIAEILELCRKIKVGPAEHPETSMGPVVTGEHHQRVLGYIEKGIEEGAALLLDGRGVRVEGCPNGFYVGPTLFDQVSNSMVIGREEIFGPVLCIKRANSFEDGLRILHENEFGNGAAIFTQSGYYARQFVNQAPAGMIGVNVAIPVPVGYFSFTGWKKSFFGDLHSHGRDGVLFYTEKKSVTYRWFDEREQTLSRIGTWG